MSTDILIGLLQLIPAMLVSSFLVFILLHLALGDPAETIAGPERPETSLRPSATGWDSAGFDPCSMPSG
jgi:ABC-type dipeptide/oligopeptide/nickel transport system permease component